MAKVVTTVDGNKTEHDIPAAPKGFTCLVHQQGIRVDVPEFVEVNPQHTINCVQTMIERQWKWISEGDTFKILWNIIFENNIPVPITIQNLKDSDMGLQHIAGLIILCCEAMFSNKSVFVRNPETYD